MTTTDLSDEQLDELLSQVLANGTSRAYGDLWEPFGVIEEYTRRYGKKGNAGAIGEDRKLPKG